MAKQAALPKPGDIIGDKYEVRRLLGSGAMGAVFEVAHRVTAKRFAIKWLLAEAAALDGGTKRFMREAQIAGRFEHPHVVEVYDVGEHEGSLYMVMELFQGESLADRLTRLHSLSQAQTLAILSPCMAGVAAAHAAGIIHRDLKPANIFLHVEGEVELPKVLDFGISKISNSGRALEATLTARGAVMGTPYYMAPEQMRGQSVDERVDVYAFGVMLYELLSGRRPYAAASYADLVLQVVEGRPTPLPELAPQLPMGLVAIVERAMARDASARYASLSQLMHALAAFQPHADPRRVAPEPLRVTEPRAPVPPPTRLDTFSAAQRLQTTARLHGRSLHVAIGALAIGLLLGWVVVMLQRSQASDAAMRRRITDEAAISDNQARAAAGMEPEAVPAAAAVAAPTPAPAIPAAVPVAASPQPATAEAVSSAPGVRSIKPSLRLPTAQPTAAGGEQHLRRLRGLPATLPAAPRASETEPAVSAPRVDSPGSTPTRPTFRLDRSDFAHETPDAPRQRPAATLNERNF